MSDTEKRSIYEFQGFRLDARRRSLSAPDNAPVLLRAKVFDTLLYLVERAGRPVDKHELMEALWPNAVVEENNLNQAISTLRRILRDERHTPRFIATLPGRGYQFVAVVRREPAGAAPLTGVPSAAAGRWKWPLFAGAASLVVGAALIAYRPTGHDAGDDATAAFRVTYQELISNFPGSHTEPTLSPDGTAIAFVSDASGASQIWVKRLAQEREPIQVTDGVAARGPAWSPRGDQIVFYRIGEGIWSVGPFGTPAARRIIEEGRNPSFSWDGESIVYESGYEIRLSAADGTQRRRVEGVPRRQLTGAWTDPALSPDGETIAFFLAEEGLLGDIWVIPSSGGEARRLTFDRREGGSPAWTPDGRYIVYASRRAGARTLWRVLLEGGEPEPVTSGTGEDSRPVLSRDGAFLVFSNARTQWSLMKTDPGTGEHVILHTRRSDIRLPTASPDGRMLAFFGEHRSGAHIFITTLDGEDVRQLTFGEGVANVLPVWSADGRSIYFHQSVPSRSLHKIDVASGVSLKVLPDFHWETRTWVAERPGGGAIAFVQWDREDWSRSRTLIRDLATGTEHALPPPVLRAPSWSRDGRRLLGWWQADERSGPYLTICPASGQGCQVVSRDGEPVIGADPRWSTDESRLLFRRPSATLSLFHELWTIDTEGTNERKLFDFGPVFGTDVQYAVAEDDQIVWVRYQRDRAELWMATLE